MIAFIDHNRDAYGVEPICRILLITPTTYHERVAQRQDSACLSARSQRDSAVKPEIARVFAKNLAVYSVRKVWRQMMREGFAVARCTAERLMREMGLAGVIRGKPMRTTISDKTGPCPRGHVNRQSCAPAPNRLWVLRPQLYTYSSPEVSSASSVLAAASTIQLYQAETRRTVPRVTNTIKPSEMPVT